MWWIARPVAVGRDQLDAHQLVGVRPCFGAEEVVDLTGGRARTAQLDSDVVGGAVARRETTGALGSRDRDFSAGGRSQDDGRAKRRIREIRDAIEHGDASVEMELRLVDGHVDVDCRQWEDHRFAVAEGDRALYSGLQKNDEQAGMSPSGDGRSECD